MLTAYGIIFEQNDKLEKIKQTCVLLPVLMETHNDLPTIKKNPCN